MNGQDEDELALHSRPDLDEAPPNSDIMNEARFRKGGLTLMPKKAKEDDSEEALIHYANIVATQQQRQRQVLQDEHLNPPHDKLEIEGKKRKFVFITPGYRKRMEARKIQINPRVLELAAQFGGKQASPSHHNPPNIPRQADKNDTDLLYLNLRKSSHSNNQK